MTAACRGPSPRTCAARAAASCASSVCAPPPPRRVPWVTGVDFATTEPLAGFRLFAIIGAWMEEDVIAATVANVFTQGCERVFLVDNNSSDGTVREAVAAGAELAEVFETEQYDEVLRLEVMNRVVREQSERDGSDHIWWLWLDADEFPHGPRADDPRVPRTARSALPHRRRALRQPFSRPCSRVRRGPAPARLPTAVRRASTGVRLLKHRKHSLQRFDRAGIEIRSDRGFHRATSAEVPLLEPLEAIYLHHFPYREGGGDAPAARWLCGTDEHGKTRVCRKATTPRTEWCRGSRHSTPCTGVTGRTFGNYRFDGEFTVAKPIERSKLAPPMISPFAGGTASRIPEKGASGALVRSAAEGTGVDADKELRRDGWRLMRSAVKPHRKTVWVGVLAGLGWTAARVAVPTMVGIAVDRTIVKHHDNGALMRWVVAILAVGAVQALCTAVRRYAAFGLAIRVETDIRMRLVAHLQRLHFAFHDEAQTGQLMSRANSDIQQINNVVLLVPLTIASTVTMILVLAILVYRSPGLAFFALGRACRSSTSRRPASRAACTRSGCSSSSGSPRCRTSVEETVTRHPRGEGLRRGAAPDRVAAGRRPKPSSTVRSRPRTCAPGSCRSSTCCRRSASSASSGTAGTRCSRATSRSATSSPRTSTCSC